jgi:hypothetical protein
MLSSFSAGFLFKKKCLGKYSTLLIKFLLFSTLLYLIWIPFAPAYFSAILKITAAYFELVGIEVSLNPTPDFLYSQGIRSCIPPFIALVLATNLSFKKKALPKKSSLEKKSFTKRTSFLSLRESFFLKGLLIGVPILFSFHVILQISYVYLQIRPTEEFYAIFVIFLSGTCRVALPILLWFALTYKQLLARPEHKKGYICPFCGASKIGILDHIRDVHEEEALKSKEVTQLLTQNPQIQSRVKK